jgi:superfamily II DNA/RNA helicase
VPNSTARRNARAPKPRHNQARTTDHRARTSEPRYNPRHDAPADRGRDNDTWQDRASRTDRRAPWTENRGDQRGTRQESWSDRRTDNRPARTDRWSDNRGADTRSQTGDRPSTDRWEPRRDRPARTDRWSDNRGAGTRGRTGDRPANNRWESRDNGPADRRDTRGADRPQVAAGAGWDGQIAEDAPGRKQASVSFAELGLPTPLLTALEAAGITEPFPIQSATLPDALSGRDVLGRAQTGSGKTLAFGLALLTRLNKGKSRPARPRGLILVPTRELAMQVADALTPLAKSLGLWCRTVVGGMSFGKQADQLQRGIDLLIATPGRLSDHVRQGTCVLDDVRFVALDEADQMADMGFLPQVRAILDLVPEGQRMLFSATLDRDVAALVNQYLTDPVTHSVSPPTATVSTMDHHLLLVSREDKAAVVAEMAAREGRTILFLRTKHHVDRLTTQLRAMGVRAGALHGGKPQGARNRVLGEFKDGRLPVLVATDVAARGIHVDNVSLVVHVDPPADAKGYLHRAGRTARAGEAGTVVTVVTHQERRTVFRMTEQAGVSPERTKVRPGDDDLVRITGARTPSGEPVVDPEPTRRPPRPGNRFNRPGARPRRHSTR